MYVYIYLNYIIYLICFYIIIILFITCESTFQLSVYVFFIEIHSHVPLCCSAYNYYIIPPPLWKELSPLQNPPHHPYANACD